MLVKSFLIAATLASSCALPTSPTLTTLQHLRLLQDSRLLPKQWIVEGSDYGRFIPVVSQWATHYGICIHFVNLEALNFEGMAFRNPTGFTILIAKEVPANAALGTIFHELAHVFQPIVLGKGPEEEAFAELVETQVMKSLGLDATPETALYLLGNVDAEIQWRVALGNHEEIDRLVRLFVNAAKGTAIDPVGIRAAVTCAP